MRTFVTLLHSAAVILLGSIYPAHSQPSSMEDYLPVDHTLTDSAGRKIEATILSKSAASVRFRRASDGKEFETPIAKLSTADQKFVNDLGKPVPIEESRLDITVLGAPVKVTRLGNGPLGIIFYGHSGSGKMMEAILAKPEAYSGLLPNRASFFLWEYPETGVFTEVKPAIAAYRSGDKEKVRPNLKGIASDVLKQIREKSGLKKFLLIGNSLGAGIILWDYKQISTDPETSFLLISPTEAFMPPVAGLGKLERTMLLSATGFGKGKEHQQTDQFLRGAEAWEWIHSNLDYEIVEKISSTVCLQFNDKRPGRPSGHLIKPSDFAMGHKIIGDHLPNELFCNIIKVKLGLKHSDILATRTMPYSKENHFSISFLPLSKRNESEKEQTVVKKASINETLRVDAPCGASALVQITEFNDSAADADKTKDGSTPLFTASYRWKFRAGPNEEVQTGQGKLIQFDEQPAFWLKTNRNDTTICAGGIFMDWLAGSIYYYKSRGAVTNLPADAFEKGF